MNLPICIGNDSSNELVKADLMEMPHLFVSWNEVSQLSLFFDAAIRSLSGHSETIVFAFAVSKGTALSLRPLFPSLQISNTYINNEISDSKPVNKYLFMNALVKEMRKRKKKLSSLAKGSPFRFNPMIVLVEDIFDLIITKRKTTGLNFLQLLIYGQELGIHFIAGSSRVYRNLLSQLVDLNPKTQSLLTANVPDLKKPFPQSLGCELIITPENFYYFKRPEQADYSRNFGIN